MNNKGRADAVRAAFEGRRGLITLQEVCNACPQYDRPTVRNAIAWLVKTGEMESGENDGEFIINFFKQRAGGIRMNEGMQTLLDHCPLGEVRSFGVPRAGFRGEWI